MIDIDASLMVLEQTGSPLGSPPRVILEQHGLWRDMPTLNSEAGVNIEDQRDALTGAITEVMKEQATYSEAADYLAMHAKQLYKNAVPDTVRSKLDEIAEEAEARGTPPLLRIHVSQAYDWLPWEILHDGVAFLGVRFRIARLPIVPSPPEVDDDDTPHPVRRVRSVLARNVIDDASDEFDTWKHTFADLLPDDRATLVPPEIAADDLWPTISGFWEEADILHVTCHGGLKDPDRKWLYWTLNHKKPQQGFAYNVYPTYVEQLNMTKSKPLVFGNACASTASGDARLEPGLGTSFFKGGALNFVGTFAPISRVAALSFARTFYEELLQNERPIADALWQAKQRHYEGAQQPADPSFLFYCLYGPPETRFKADAGNDAGDGGQ